MSVDDSQGLGEPEREAVLARLKDAFAAGHLTRAEMEQHLDTALGARDERDLVPVREALPPSASPRTVSLGGTGGRIRRRGAWQVPAVLEVVSEYGAVDLDLTRAVFEQPDVTIDLRLTYGSARITVPAGASVDLDGLRTEWTQPAYRPPAAGAGRTSGVRVTVVGTMEFGRLKVRHGAG